MDFSTKSLRILTGTLFVYLLLVATHLGEFWPFSIYPMFSQAGNPWTRSLVREVDTTLTPDWTSKYNVGELPGETFAMNRVGINQNDLANFISKTKKWDQGRIDGLQSLFRPELEKKALMIYKVRGELINNRDTVRITYQPYILLHDEVVRLHPEIKNQQANIDS